MTHAFLPLMVVIDWRSVHMRTVAERPYNASPALLNSYNMAQVEANAPLAGMPYGSDGVFVLAPEPCSAPLYSRARGPSEADFFDRLVADLHQALPNTHVEVHHLRLDRPDETPVHLAWLTLDPRNPSDPKRLPFTTQAETDALHEVLEQTFTPWCEFLFQHQAYTQSLGSILEEGRDLSAIQALRAFWNSRHAQTGWTEVIERNEAKILADTLQRETPEPAAITVASRRVRL